MGHRANLILVEKKGFRVFYSHWAAVTLPEDLFWGPRNALEFIKSHEEEDPEESWLDFVMAEGGVVLDPYAQKLLVFGSGYLSGNIPLRRLCLEWMRRTWAGWEIEYAGNGVLTLSNYMNYEGHEDLYQDYLGENIKLEEGLRIPEEMFTTDFIATITHADGTRKHYPLDGCFLDAYLKIGPRMVAMGRGKGFDEVDWDDWNDRFPIAGWHVDVPNRTLSFWKTLSETNLHEELGSRWPGWTIVNLEDRFEAQLEESAGTLKLPVPSRKELEEELTELLLAEDRFDGPGSMLEMLASQKKRGKDYEVNPRAFSDPPDPRPSAPLRRQILEKVKKKNDPGEVSQPR